MPPARFTNSRPSKERDEVIEQESLIRCVGYGSFGVGLSDLLMNGANRLIGIGRMVVVLCSLEISFIVCKKRSGASYVDLTFTVQPNPSRLVLA
jgi:hypothetical protein